MYHKNDVYIYIYVCMYVVLSILHFQGTGKQVFFHKTEINSDIKALKAGSCWKGLRGKL